MLTSYFFIPFYYLLFVSLYKTKRSSINYLLFDWTFYKTKLFYTRLWAVIVNGTHYSICSTSIWINIFHRLYNFELQHTTLVAFIDYLSQIRIRCYTSCAFFIRIMFTFLFFRDSDMIKVEFNKITQLG